MWWKSSPIIACSNFSTVLLWKKKLATKAKYIFTSLAKSYFTSCGQFLFISYLFFEKNSIFGSYCHCSVFFGKVIFPFLLSFHGWFGVLQPEKATMTLWKNRSKLDNLLWMTSFRCVTVTWNLLVGQTHPDGQGTKASGQGRNFVKARNAIPTPCWHWLFGDFYEAPLYT